MNLVGSGVLQTVHLCVWMRKAEENMLGTTTTYSIQLTSSYELLFFSTIYFIFPLSIPEAISKGGLIFKASYLYRHLSCCLHVCILFSLVFNTHKINTLLFLVLFPSASWNFRIHVRKKASKGNLRVRYLVLSMKDYKKSSCFAFQNKYRYNFWNKWCSVIFFACFVFSSPPIHQRKSPVIFFPERYSTLLFLSP